MVRLIAKVLLVLVGLINIFPVIGAISGEHLVGLYGVTPESNSIMLLLRHRAVLFGLLGAFLIYSAFRSAVRLPAIVAGVVSMLAFIVLEAPYDGIGPELKNVVIADVIGLLMFGVAIVLLVVSRDRGSPG